MRIKITHSLIIFRKRSVKFSLPSKKSTLPTSANLPVGFEVPEASMLLEESIPLSPPTAYSPYRYFPSTTPLQTRCCRYAHSHHHRQGKVFLLRFLGGIPSDYFLSWLLSVIQL